MDIVRGMQRDADDGFLRRWELQGSPNDVAMRMGPRLTQAYRDMTGDSFATGDVVHDEWETAHAVGGLLGKSPQVSTRILGRRTAPLPPFLISNRVPHGFAQDLSTYTRLAPRRRSR